VKVETLESKLKVKDRLYFNACFKLDQWKNSWVVYGRNAMHVLDLDKLECVESRDTLNYVQLIPPDQG